MKQSTPYPPPVLRPPMFNAASDSGFPGSWRAPSPQAFGSYGHWAPRPPPGPWHGGWNPWGAPQGYQQFPNFHPGGPNYFTHGNQMQEGNGYRGNNKDRRNRKKEPVFEYSCDTCDRGFKSQEKYDEHVSQHVKCQVAECNFRAHEKLVQIHWRTMHGPGAKRIKLDTPEEIAKWREERRKNFPTLENIAKKQQLQREKEERGEVLQTAQFGKMKGMRSGNTSGNGKNKWSRKNHRKQRNLQNKFGDTDAGRQTECPQAQHRRDAPAQEPSVNPLDMLAGSDAESDSGGELKNPALTVIPRQVTSGLSNLISSYGSASDSDSEPEQLPIKKVAKALEDNKQMLESLSRSVAPASAHVQAEQQTGASRTANPNKGHPQQQQKGQKSAVTSNKRPTLLEMLLAPDIRHERNVILQCVRYIVQNNFFDPPPVNTNQNITSDSSMKDAENLNSTEKKCKRLGGKDAASNIKKRDTHGDFSRPLEPLDDEIWENNANCLETFCD